MTKIPQQSDIVLFRTTDEKISISVVMEHETVWLTQDQMAELFRERQEHYHGAHTTYFLRRRIGGKSGMSGIPTNHTAWSYRR